YQSGGSDEVAAEKAYEGLDKATEFFDKLSSVDLKRRAAARKAEAPTPQPVPTFPEAPQKKGGL
ncbi:MAG: hypothetical protein AAB875_02685, partial [Patescibacteria group bacterium]